MKICSKCGESQDEGKFYKGQSWCKSCIREYDQTPERRKSKMEASNRYGRSKKGIAKKRADQKTDRALAFRKEYAKRPERRKRLALRSRTNYALTYPDSCPFCGSTEEIHAHHHSYEKPNSYKDVAFMCAPCHLDWHRGMKLITSNDRTHSLGS